MPNPDWQHQQRNYTYFIEKKKNTGKGKAGEYKRQDNHVTSTTIEEHPLFPVKNPLDTLESCVVHTHTHTHTKKRNKAQDLHSHQSHREKRFLLVLNLSSLHEGNFKKLKNQHQAQKIIKKENVSQSCNQAGVSGLVTFGRLQSQVHTLLDSFTARWNLRMWSLIFTNFPAI